MLKIIKFALCAGMMTGATVAMAADLPAEVTNDVMQTCRSDYHRVCSEVLPGDGRIGRCLLDHEAELSPGCLKKVKFAYAVEVCMPDYQHYCAGMPPGAARAVQCLAHRIGSLSPECERVVAANAPYFSPEGPRYGDNRYGAPYSGPAHEPYRGYPDAGPRDAQHDAYPPQPYGDDRYAGGGYSGYNVRPNGDGRYADHGYYSGEQAGGDRRYDDESEDEGEEREPPR